jgi:putative transposase
MNYGDTLHILHITLIFLAGVVLPLSYGCMSRLARFVAPGFPHHVTQRGNRRAPVFFEDRRLCAVPRSAGRALPQGIGRLLGLLPDAEPRAPDPRTGDGGRSCPRHRETQRQYTGFVNARARWTGHLFQGRFSSVALDEEHLMLAARYVALDPARARPVQRPQDWAWSSLRAHLAGRDDGLVTVERPGQITTLVDTEPEEAAPARCGSRGSSPRL